MDKNPFKVSYKTNHILQTTLQPDSSTQNYKNQHTSTTLQASTSLKMSLCQVKPQIASRASTTMCRTNPVKVRAREKKTSLITELTWSWEWNSFVFIRKSVQLRGCTSYTVWRGVPVIMFGGVGTQVFYNMYYLWCDNSLVQKRKEHAETNKDGIYPKTTKQRRNEWKRSKINWRHT